MNFTTGIASGRAAALSISKVGLAMKERLRQMRDVGVANSVPIGMNACRWRRHDYWFRLGFGFIRHEFFERWNVKTLGVLGGLSWRSTIFYYEGVNAAIEQALGPMHSARLAIWSFDLQSFLGEGVDWREDADSFISAARQLEKAGVDGVLIAANSIHFHADAIEAAISVPLLHIGDAVADAARSGGIGRAGLIGIPVTMEEEFYVDRIQRQGIEVVVPRAELRDRWGKVIYDELFAGSVTRQGAELMEETCAFFYDQRCESVILGCTELRMLGCPETSLQPLDSVNIHVNAATRFLLQGK